jgi:iron complex transport system substrate-binding protein
MRRCLRGLAAAVAALLLLAGCGGPGGEGDAGGEGGGPQVPAAEDGAFPVTIDHQYGRTTLTQQPRRVVALETVHLDALLALGVVPVGALRFDFDPSGVPPWDRQQLDTGQTTLISVTDGVSVEQVASLQPDLIFGSWAVAEDRAVWERLNRVAPTIGLLGDGVEGTWQEVTRTVGRALGLSGRADDVVADVEAELRRFVADHPGLEGKTQALAAVFGPNQIGVIASPQDNATRFFEQIGLSVAPGIAGLSPEQANSLSQEQLQRLDGDVLVIGAFDPGGMRQMERNPLFKQIPAVRAGSYAVLDAAALNAVRTPTPGNIGYILDQLGPALRRAAGA